MSFSVSSVAAAATPQVWSGASARMAPPQKMTALFASIDSSGSGSITRAQFDQAFQANNPPAAFKAMGADAVFNAIAPAGSDSVSKDDFVQGMTSLMGKLKAGHHHHGGHSSSTETGQSGAVQSLTYSLNALNGVTTAPTSSAGSTLDVAA
jgi:hypothetical protein